MPGSIGRFRLRKSGIEVVSDVVGRKKKGVPGLLLQLNSQINYKFMQQ